MSSESNKSSQKKIPSKSKAERSLRNIRTKDYRIAIAWARALFHVAKQNNSMNRIVEDFEGFIHIWDQLQLMRDFIGCYAIDRRLKKEKLAEFFTDKFSAPFMAFIQMIVTRGEAALFSSIYDAFIEMHDELEGRERVTVRSATPFTQEQTRNLEEVLQRILERRSVLMNSEINPDLLGGFIVNANNIRIDTSLKNDLECLKRNILTMERKQDEH